MVVVSIIVIERNRPNEFTTVGLDLAKNVFQVHGINAAGDVIVRRRLRRSEVREFFAGMKSRLIGMEACGTAHFWGRELAALGHKVKSIPVLAKAALRPLVARLRATEKATSALDNEIVAWHKNNEASLRLAMIPGVGYLTASVIAATAPDPSYFRSGREFAACVGLVPRQNSSGGKEQLGRISKQGNRYIRRLLVIGATSMLRYARTKTAPGTDWVNGLLERRPARLVADKQPSLILPEALCSQQPVT